MQTKIDADVDIVDRQLHDTIRQLIDEENRNEQAERRNEHREPFFRPVNIILDGGVTKIAGFTRDISLNGIGLTHSYTMRPGEVIVEIPRRSDMPCFLRVEILWNDRMAPDWCNSGGRILEEVRIDEL